MKTVNEYMKLPYRMELVEDVDEGGFVVSFPDLKGCLSSGETAEDAVRNAMDAKREWIAAALEEGYEIPEPLTEADYSGQFKVPPHNLSAALAAQFGHLLLAVFSITNQVIFEICNCSCLKLHPLPRQLICAVLP